MSKQAGWIGVAEGAVASSVADLAWAAGFFDGEGSIFLSHAKRVPHRDRANPARYDIISPCLSIAQVDPRPLLRFTKIVGGRKPNGPYKPKTPKSKPYYRLNAAGRWSVHRILVRLWPYLSEPKKEQARRVWSQMEAEKGKKSPPIPPLPADFFGVDLDRTLAFYPDGVGITDEIGEPVPDMLERVKAWIAQDREVRIVTARVASVWGPERIQQQVEAIHTWCQRVGLPRLQVTAEKDFRMVELWDDRAIRVEPNIGEPCPACLDHRALTSED